MQSPDSAELVTLANQIIEIKKEYRLNRIQNHILSEALNGKQLKAIRYPGLTLYPKVLCTRALENLVGSIG
jgi:hypothetical protein